MKIRLGYVAMTLNLEDCSPSGTVTLSRISRMPDERARLYRLRKTTRKNLENTLRILRYNLAMGIKVYRLTSKLVPLATHPVIEDWDYAGEFGSEFREIGDFIKENDFRVSAHPDHFTIINSPVEKVVADSIKDLEYHNRLYRAMGLEDCSYKLVMHVGGLYKDKISSIARFKENFVKLPDNIRKRIIIENDDKSYSAGDVLELCTELETPMVIDIHHYNCLKGSESLESLLPAAFSTWKNEYFVPKIHFSSPRSEKEFRSHADYIDFESFCSFLKIAAGVNRDFDIMIEAKAKNLALEKLAEQLDTLDWVRRINDTEFEIFSN